EAVWADGQPNQAGYHRPGKAVDQERGDGRCGLHHSLTARREDRFAGDLDRNNEAYCEKKEQRGEDGASDPGRWLADTGLLPAALGTVSFSKLVERQGEVGDDGGHGCRF